MTDFQIYPRGFVCVTPFMLCLFIKQRDLMDGGVFGFECMPYDYKFSFVEG